MTHQRGAHIYPVQDSHYIHQGKLFSLREDTIEMLDGSLARRDVLVHPGAVAIAAVNADNQICLVKQFRHPLRSRVWELPAGLLDHVGEDPLEAAKRELAEEAEVSATKWRTLVDLVTSPGISTEAVRVYLARNIQLLPDTAKSSAHDEEADMAISWQPLNVVVQACLTGVIESAHTVAGVLAAAHFRAAGWNGARAADVSWPARPIKIGEPAK